MDLARRNIVPVYAMDYKDKSVDALSVLNQRGNPYVKTVSDSDGRVGIDYGVYGVPETYVIDKQGIIRYKQIGPVTAQNLREKILPLVAELEKK
jgi:cytochrome c biogenesis protein CcmG/thiol:disulfide interchange protein DsbE